MSASQPRVTVLMAVYDGEPYLRPAIDSVLVQTFTDLELLIVDDGSTDGSREIVRSYGDDRIRLLENGRNLGLAASLNRGIAAAAGELIARLDADDVCEADRLARQVAFMDAHKDVALLGSGYHQIDEIGGIVKTRRLPTDHTDLCWALLFYCPFVHSAVMVRTDALRRLGGYDEVLAYSMDYELWRRVAASFRVANLEAPLIRYRVSSHSMTATYGPRALEGRSIAIAGVSEMLGWSEGDAGRRFDILQAVVKEPPLPLTLEEIRWAVTEAHRLHDAFTRSFDLSPAERAHRSRSLRAAIGSRIIEMLRQFPHRYDLPTAVRVMSAALQAHPRTVLTRAFAAAAVKQLVGGRNRAAGEP